MKEFTIREAKTEDAPELVKVHVQSWRETYQGIVSDEYLEKLDIEKRMQAWRKNIAPGGEASVNLVAIDSSKNIVGFVSGGKARKDIGYTAELMSLYILESFQKKNLGFKLTQELVQKLKTKGYKNMYVGVLEQNPSKGFYQKYGAEFIFSENIKIGKEEHLEEFYGWKDLSAFLY